MSSGGSIKKQAFSESLPRASIQDLGVILMGAGYEVIVTFVPHLPPNCYFCLLGM
jgi:hypothetical protein